MEKGHSHCTYQKTRTNTQQIYWKYFPYAAFAVSSLQLNTATPVWHLFQAMTLVLCFPRAREKKSGSSTPKVEDVFEEQQSRDRLLLGLEEQSQPRGMAWTLAGCWPCGDEKKGWCSRCIWPSPCPWVPCLLEGCAPSPGCCLVLHRQLFTGLPSPCPSTSKCPSSFI